MELPFTQHHTVLFYDSSYSCKIRPLFLSHDHGRYSSNNMLYCRYTGVTMRTIIRGSIVFMYLVLE